LGHLRRQPRKRAVRRGRSITSVIGYTSVLAIGISFYLFSECALNARK
jgi:hypothetical protein